VSSLTAGRSAHYDLAERVPVHGIQRNRQFLYRRELGNNARRFHGLQDQPGGLRRPGPRSNGAAIFQYLAVHGYAVGTFGNSPLKLCKVPVSLT